MSYSNPQILLMYKHLVVNHN